MEREHSIIDIVRIDKNIFNINYSYATCQFGDIIIASSDIGICHLHFIDDKAKALSDLKQKFLKAEFHHITDAMQENAIALLQHQQQNHITLHIKGTDFQLKIWRELLKIPIGKLVNYSDIANNINQPQALRAIGSAIGKNPIAYLIPCHRIIPKNAPKNNAVGNYMWGSERKQAIINWEKSL